MTTPRALSWIGWFSGIRGILAVLGGIALVAGAWATLSPKVRAQRAQRWALARASEQRAAGDDRGALSTLLACGRDPLHCECSDTAAELAMDLARYAEAALALTSSQCPSMRREGLRAEALAGTGQRGLALIHAAHALTTDPDEPHACFAKAWLLSSSQVPEALMLAEKAVRGGRGVPALLLLAKLRDANGDAAGARAAIEQAVAAAPHDPRVALDLGVVEQAAGRYTQARTAYLHALALDPKLADARYDLAIMTHTAGANAEAWHDMEELAAIAPDDPRLPMLRGTLDGGGADSRDK